MELGECGKLSCVAPWFIDESSSAPKWTAHPRGSKVLHLDVLFSLHESSEDPIPPLQIYFSFAPGSRIKLASFASNARFVEAYSRAGDSLDLEYIKTFRGVSNPNPGSDPDILAHSLELNISPCLVLKMVSIRPPQSKECFLLGLEMEVDMSARPSTVSAPPKGPQPAAPSPVPTFVSAVPLSAQSAVGGGGGVGVGGGESLGMLMHAVTGMLVQAQAKLVGQMSSLLDQKLSPIVQRLNRIEVQLEQLQADVGTRAVPSSPAVENPHASSDSSQSVI